MKSIFALLFVLVLFSCKKEDKYRIKQVYVDSVSVQDTLSLNESAELEIYYTLSGCQDFERVVKTQNGKELEFKVYIKQEVGDDVMCITAIWQESKIESITFTETGLHTLVFNDGELVKEVYVE